ncbi:MAG TPA: hypothetical protein VHO24_06795 [Opitutaceae bacterium]|nr:hypothetical protein [Opitutaceae bacterium]
MAVPVKLAAIAFTGLLLVAGCVSQEGKPFAIPTPAPAPQNVNWEEVDKSTARTKEREGKSAWKKTETTTEEKGYLPMSDDEYASALTDALTAVKSENPKLSDSEVEEKARQRADEAKRQYENSYRTRTSTSVKWSSP